MSKRICWMCLLGLGLAMVVGVLGVVVTHRAWAWVKSTSDAARPHELRTEDIRPTFLRLTGHDLPSNTSNLRAIGAGGFGPEIFVCFRTDLAGIEYVLKAFSGRRSSLRTLGTDDLRAMDRSGEHLFLWPSVCQERLGICLFDQALIKSARLLARYGGTLAVLRTMVSCAHRR
jgi:hypothetical protein